METALPVVTLDDPTAPDLFANLAIGAVEIGGCLQITWASNRNDYTTVPPTARNVVVARLVMPLPAVEDLLAFVGKYMEELKAAKGRVPPVIPPRSIN